MWFKGIAQQFGKYDYSLTCNAFNEKINTTHVYMLRLT